MNFYRLANGFVLFNVEPGRITKFDIRFDGDLKERCPRVLERDEDGFFIRTGPVRTYRGENAANFRTEGNGIPGMDRPI